MKGLYHYHQYCHLEDTDKTKANKHFKLAIKHHCYPAFVELICKLKNKIKRIEGKESTEVLAKTYYLLIKVAMILAKHHFTPGFIQLSLVFNFLTNRFIQIIPDQPEYINLYHAYLKLGYDAADCAERLFTLSAKHCLNAFFDPGIDDNYSKTTRIFSKYKQSLLRAMISLKIPIDTNSFDIQIKIDEAQYKKYCDDQISKEEDTDPDDLQFQY